jgi:hypothetical protein
MEQMRAMRVYVVSGRADHFWARGPLLPAPGSTSGPAYRAKTNKFRSRSRMRQKWRKSRRCVYTWIEGERAIFGPAARFCPAPGGTQGAHIEQKQNNSDPVGNYGTNGEQSGDACIRGLRASGPFLGPRPAFAPRRAAPRVRISSKKQINSDRARACGRNGANAGDACIRGFRASGPFLGPRPAFARAGQHLRARISSKNK